MRVSIIKDKKIQNTLLPNTIVGSFWLVDTDQNGVKRNLISIEADQGRWKLISNRDVYCLGKDNSNTPFLYLQSDGFYYIKNSVENITYLVYCSDITTNYTSYVIDDGLQSGYNIGNNEDAYIKYNILDKNVGTIKKENEKVYIYDNGCKYGIYINNVRVEKRKELRSGDIIFIAGLKIIYSIFQNPQGGLFSVIFVNSNNNIAVKGMPANLDTNRSNINFNEPEEEAEYPLYDEKEYFHKKPRFKYQLKQLVLQIDPPPAKQEDSSNSFLLTVGPMITMSMTSLVTGYTAINNVLSGTTTWKGAMPSLVVCGAMFASVFIWPLFSKMIEKKNRWANERRRQKKYKKYIDEKKSKIQEGIKEQSTILRNNNPKIEDIETTIIQKHTTLWQKRIEDEDFLEVSLGDGNCPMQIDIKYPEDRFSMVEDNLKNMVSELGSEPKTLINVPIVYSFIKNYIGALVGKEQVTGEYARRLILQLLAFHSFDDLKIIFLTDDEHEYQWSCFKTLSHLFADDKTIRFFATDNDEYKEVCYYLEKVYNNRKEHFGQSDPKIDELDKIYLIITDSFKKVRNYNVIDSILHDKKNYGFSLFIIDEKLTNLPDQCSKFIQVSNEKGAITSTYENGQSIEFKVDFTYDVDYEKCIRTLSNIPIEVVSQEEGQLPNKLGFLEMYDVGKLEQLNSLNRWQKSNPMLNLSVPIGIGKNGEKVNVDLHEKYHGPHGLIAGMTGSGKSELIITYILSMALNYHPYEVQFILIDYKGGGLAGAFENANIGLKLPHLVGTITNLDANEIKRSLASIESELKRRQALFNKAREASGESTIDIYKYQKLYRDKVVDEPVSHLFIISDEFAELKNQQPEFMEQLISTARIGRSLGVHLILATQKPSGVVDPQIWSNTRFRICMRVQDTSDSNEVIKCKDAAYLKQTGRFYFQVGYNEVFVLGQAAWAGGKYLPTEKVSKTLDTSVNFIDNIGMNIKTVETRERKEIQTKSNGEELLNIVKYLDSLAKQQQIQCRPLWLEKISDFIRVEDLAQKYNFQRTPFNLDIIIGEYDVPQRQEQKLLTVPISNDGNVAVFGASGSGKENFITTLIYSSMLYYTPDEVNYYIVDFGAEALKMFRNSSIVGDVLMVDDEDKLNNLFKMISTTIEDRKELFVDYNGDYQNYCKNSGKTVSNLVIVINNYETFQEVYPDLDESLTILSRDANKYGIYFVITVNTPNGMRFKLKQNFSTLYSLQQNNEDDYSTILGNVHKTYPSKIFGRGIIKLDGIYEFQTALVCERDNITKFIKEKCDEFASKYQSKAKSIPVLPTKVSYVDIKDEFNKTDDLIIGIDKNTLEISKFNFNKSFATMITSVDLVTSTNFVNPLINQIVATNKYQLIVINADDYVIDDSYKQYYKYVDDDFNGAFTSLLNFADEKYDQYTQNKFNKGIFKDDKKIFCFIIGIDAFKTKLGDEEKTKFGEIFKKTKDLGVINYALIDSIDKIKKVELESWYKDCVDNDSGIWIGNGINDQFSLKISQRIENMREDVPEGFCFVVTRGRPKYVKYVEELPLKK